MKGSVDAILMASGFSERFGAKDKLLARFAGVPLAERTLRLVCGSGLFQAVRFVYSSPAVGALTKGYPVEPVFNENPCRGARESVRLGVLPSRADFYLFIPCDQPLLDERTLRLILDRREQGRIVVPAFAGQPGSPALFSAFFRDELLTLADGRNARELRARHPEQVRMVEVANPLALADADTKEEFCRLERVFLLDNGNYI